MSNHKRDSLPYAQHYREEMAKFVPTDAKALLDVGCYTGNFGKKLKIDRTVEIWGIEPNAEASVKAAEVLDKVVNSQLSKDVDLPNKYFDAIIFNDVLEHMNDPSEALEIVKNSLKDDGYIVASIPNMLHIDNLIHIIRDRDFHYEPWGIRDKTHLRFFTLKSASRLFNECGYDIVQVEGINENWWKPSILRRIAFKLLAKQLEETKYIQFAFVLKQKQK